MNLRDFARKRKTTVNSTHLHDIWNPWHGCVRKSPGCAHCYMFTLDKMRGADGSRIYKTANMRYPLQRNRDGSYKIKSGEQIRVCMTSDFFLEEADPWRNEAWNVMFERPDVVFFLLTKRPERVAECLPRGWGDGWENIFLQRYLRESADGRRAYASAHEVAVQAQGSDVCSVHRRGFIVAVAQDGQD